MRGVTMNMRKKRPTPSALPEELVADLKEMNELAAEMGDGAWYQMLQDAVTDYNTRCGTHYVECDTVNQWLTS